jgi:hypothetical protein
VGKEVPATAGDVREETTKVIVAMGGDAQCDHRLSGGGIQLLRAELTVTGPITTDGRDRGAPLNGALTAVTTFRTPIPNIASRTQRTATDRHLVAVASIWH